VLSRNGLDEFRERSTTDSRIPSRVDGCAGEIVEARRGLTVPSSWYTNRCASARRFRVRGYLELARARGVLLLTATQLYARLPLGMMSLAVLLHIQARTGSYATAGLVVACVSVGQAVATPVTARLAGIVGAVTTLAVTATGNAAALLLLAFIHPNPLLLCLIGVLVGLSVPPLMPVVRALYPRLVRDDLVPVLFALDTSAQELIWIIGPLAATLLATAVATPAPLIAAAVVTFTGTFGFLFALGARSPRIGRSMTTFGRVLTGRAVITAMIASGGLVASFMALEVAIVTRFDHNGAVAGAIIALSSFGSLVGGLLIGHRRLGLAGVAGMLALVAVGTALTGVFQPLPLQCIAAFAAGLGFAPAMSSLYLTVSLEVPEEATTEAFGWLHTASLVGAAAGTASAGAMSESHGAAGAFAVATLIAVCSVIVPPAVRLVVPRPSPST
jgi:MFS family permease